MGHTNTAASVSAVVFSGHFNLAHTYFLVAGIAGMNPNAGTIGSATWARYLIDFGIQHEIDAREKPRGWVSGYFGIHTIDPDAKPDFAYRTELFQLDADMLRWALSVSSKAQLDDNDVARAYRSRYRQETARRPPSVLQCDTVAGDTYWHGNLLAERAEKWTSLLTDGKGRYCTTQQEDNATYEVLKRGAAAQLLDLRRLAVLRTGANFDRPYPGESAYDSLKAKSGGFQPALHNLIAAGLPLVNEIVGNWSRWEAGIPDRATPSPCRGATASDRHQP
jgi:purine nucleoside permease